MTSAIFFLRKCELRHFVSSEFYKLTSCQVYESEVERAIASEASCKGGCDESFNENDVESAKESEGERDNENETFSESKGKKSNKELR